MADRPLKLPALRRCLFQFNVWEDSSRGKGSHTMFFRRLPEGVFGYPIPTHEKEVRKHYVTGCRRKFRLTPEFGVSDDSFYGPA